MNFVPNITTTWTLTNLAIKDAYEQACKEILGPMYIPTCTSGNSGDHSIESGHFHGRALDFRSHDIPEVKKPLLTKRMIELLGPNYYMVLERNLETKQEHFHVQRNKNTF